MELEGKKKKKKNISFWKLKGDSNPPQFYGTGDPFTTFSEHFPVFFVFLYKEENTYLQ